MKIAILGAGALGCYYGARLHESGADVHFIMRSAYEPVAQHGLELKSVDGDLHIPKPSIYRNSQDCGPVDLVLVCWKTTANKELATALPPLLHENTRVLSLQNGMGNAESIAEYVAPEKVFIGLCFVCAMMNEPGKIVHLEGGDIQFAPYVTREDTLAELKSLPELFAPTHIRTRAFEQAEQIQWCKLCWNIPFNGLCLAHGGISIEELFRMPKEVERAHLVMEEVYATATKRGYLLPRDIVEKQMERTAKMGAFIPSSAVDYLKGREVEYNAIWGETLRRAHEVEACVPEWERLAADIRQVLSST